MITPEYECSAVVSTANFRVNAGGCPGIFHVVFKHFKISKI